MGKLPEWKREVLQCADCSVTARSGKARRFALVPCEAHREVAEEKGYAPETVG